MKPPIFSICSCGTSLYMVLSHRGEGFTANNWCTVLAHNKNSRNYYITLVRDRRLRKKLLKTMQVYRRQNKRAHKWRELQAQIENLSTSGLRTFVSQNPDSFHRIKSLAGRFLK